MMETMVGASYDELLAGPEEPTMTAFVRVSSDTTVERGTLLACNWNNNVLYGAEVKAADATNGSHLLVGTGEQESSTVVTAYWDGRFNRNALKLPAGVNLQDFELELRRQNILLTEAI